MRKILIIIGLIIVISCKKQPDEFNYVRYVVEFDKECQIIWLDKKGYHKIKQFNGLWETEFKTLDFIPKIDLKAVSKSKLSLTIYLNGSLMRYKKGSDSLQIKN